MRRSFVLCVLLISLLLAACGRAGDGNTPLERALIIRNEYLAASGCEAGLTVTADYGARVYTYAVDAVVDDLETVLTVTAPEEVAGVTVRCREGQGQLCFDGAVLETGVLTDDGLTPLAAVPELLKQARTGFVDHCGNERLGERDVLRVLCRDPAQEPGSGLETALWFDSADHTLVRGELSSDGRRVILCEFERFALK